MRSVRCDVCGTKALMAASQCPKCGHGFEVRDGFGSLLPLSHCSTCDSYYPAKLGSCRWCGTPPARAPIAPYVWKGVGVAAFVAMAWGAWLVHDDPPADVSAARMKAILKPDSSASAGLATDSVVSAGSIASATVADSLAVADTTAVVSGDAANPPATGTAMVVAAIDTTPTAVATGVVGNDSMATQPEAVPVRDPAPVTPPPVPRPPARAVHRSVVRVPGPTLARAPAPTRARASTKPAPRVTTASKPAVKPPAKAAAKSRTRVVWVSTVARNWVVVRAGASRQARVIASIGPNTRVQLGESRGGWRRIRAKGLAGWVEHRSFFASVGVPRKAGSLAAR